MNDTYKIDHWHYFAPHAHSLVGQSKLPQWCEHIRELWPQQQADGTRSKRRRLRTVTMDDYPGDYIFWEGNCMLGFQLPAAWLPHMHPCRFALRKMCIAVGGFDPKGFCRMGNT